MSKIKWYIGNELLEINNKENNIFDDDDENYFTYYFKKLFKRFLIL